MAKRQTKVGKFKHKRQIFVKDKEIYQSKQHRINLNFTNLWLADKQGFPNIFQIQMYICTQYLINAFEKKNGNRTFSMNNYCI